MVGVEVRIRQISIINSIFIYPVIGKFEIRGSPLLPTLGQLFLLDNLLLRFNLLLDNLVPNLIHPIFREFLFWFLHLHLLLLCWVWVGGACFRGFCELGAVGVFLFY